MKRPFTSKQIKAIRERLDLSQEDFARMVGVTTRCVSYWEAGRSHPRRKQRQALEQLAKG